MLAVFVIFYKNKQISKIINFLPKVKHWEFMNIISLYYQVSMLAYNRIIFIIKEARQDFKTCQGICNKNLKK